MELYELAQKRDDEALEGLLASLLAPDSIWEVSVAEARRHVAGFVAVRLDRATRLGESGLNAVEPAHAGRGIGTAMYEFALAHMKAEGILVATVGAGGDPSHAPARRVHRKVGFDVEIPGVWMVKKL
jgi:GNAT superfamily N-acetyltransferase